MQTWVVALGSAALCLVVPVAIASVYGQAERPSSEPVIIEVDAPAVSSGAARSISDDRPDEGPSLQQANTRP